MISKDIEEKTNSLIEQIRQKLRDIEMYSIIDEGLYTQMTIPEIETLVEELRTHALSTNADTKTILNAINELKTIVEQQQSQVRKLVSLVTKLYEDGEINKDTFNKLDEFLKEYHDHPYQDGKC